MRASRLALSCTVLIAAACMPRAAEPPDGPSIVQFRLVEAAKGEDTEAMAVKGTNETLHVNKQVLLDASAIASAKAIVGDQREPAVVLKLTQEGGEKFKEITGSNIKRRLAIIYAGELMVAPRIMTAIKGDACITGNLTREETRKIADKINEAIHKKPPTAKQEAPPAK